MNQRDDLIDQGLPDPGTPVVVVVFIEPIELANSFKRTVIRGFVL